MLGSLIAKQAVKVGLKSFENHDLKMSKVGWRNDVTMIYPAGDVLPGGKFQGKDAVTQWVKNAMDYFPVYKIDIKHVCVQNLFDLIGNNVITVLWNETRVDCEGITYHLDGLSKITLRGFRAIEMKDYVFSISSEPKN